MSKLVKAQAKNVKGSPQKARIVANAVRGMDALEAIEVLRYMQKGAAKKVRKVLESAVANAIHNENMNAGDLFISKIMIDDARTLRRGRAESKGRYRLILKRNSHITIYLGQRSAPVSAMPAESAEQKSEKKAKPAKARKTAAKKTASPKKPKKEAKE